MAAAHGDALLGEQVGQVGAVYPVHGEAGQGQLRRPDQADTCACAQAGEQLGVQRGFVRRHGGLIEAGEVVQRRAQSDDRGDRRSPGLEAQRRRAEGRALIVGLQHHFAAELPVAQLRQGLAATIEQADAVRAIELVPGADIEVAAQRLHILATVHGALGAIHHAQCALGAGQVDQPGDRLLPAQHVG